MRFLAKRVAKRRISCINGSGNLQRQATRACLCAADCFWGRRNGIGVSADRIPQSILYDNTRLAVSQIIKGGERRRAQMFAELQSHYLFADRFGRPGKGNDKGKVEGLVGYVQRNFMTPLPLTESLRR
jgi:hypothetical protein